MTNENPNRPSHIVYQIIPNPKEGGKDFFRRIGAVWPNRKNDGFNMVLEAAPLMGRIAILPPKEGDAEGAVEPTEEIPF